MPSDQEVLRQILPERPAHTSEIDFLAAMHLDPQREAIAEALQRRGPEFRFYRDKMRLFHEIEPEGVIVVPAINPETGEEEIAGFGLVSLDVHAAKLNAIRRGPALRMVLKALTLQYGVKLSMLKKLAILPYALLGKWGVKRQGDSNVDLPPAKYWSLIVSKDYRRCGIGLKLGLATSDYVKAHGGDRIMLTVELDNTAAQEVHLKTGYYCVGKMVESVGRSYIYVRDLERP